MNQKSPITTHVLDTSSGLPAAGVGVELFRLDETGSWRLLAGKQTDSDGRINDLIPPSSLAKGRFRLVFATGAYFQRRSIGSFYPEVSIEFEVSTQSEHYHVPLLLSPFGYSTYRGS